MSRALSATLSALLIVPMYVSLIAVPCQVPDAIVPTEVSEDATTAPPNVVAFRTDAPLI